MSYLPLNPFIQTSVGESDLWGSRSWVDVPQIHAAAFAELTQTVQAVRSTRRTQVRFVRGAGGSGKSHLFTRLRMHEAERVFYAYAPNPPLQPGALEAFVLSRLIASLRHPARMSGGLEAGFSQLRWLGYALLQPLIEQSVPLTDLHVAWAAMPLVDRKELIHQAVLALEQDHPQVPRSVLRALLSVLREDKEHLAAQWLAGATYLTEADLKFLGVPEPLRREDCGIVVQLLGRLAARVGLPFLLVMDQLDLVSTAEQLDEFQRLLFSLIDQSEHWVVLIGLVAERYTAWDAGLTQALRGRIGQPDAQAPLGFRLPVTDVLPIATVDKEALLMARLASPALVEQRKKDGITLPTHPFGTAEITRLTSGGAIFPRHLLAAAGEMYGLALARVDASQSSGSASQSPGRVEQSSGRVEQSPGRVEQSPGRVEQSPGRVEQSSGRVEQSPGRVEQSLGRVEQSLGRVEQSPGKVALSVKLLELIQASLPTDAVAESAVDLGERVRELIQVMAGKPVELREGDLRRSYPGFDGSDFLASWGGGQVRVITTDAVRNSFIAVLERLLPVPAGALLLRHAAAGITGQLTLEMLTSFRQKNTFHHVPVAESSLLGALSRVLAEQREGNLEALPTDPPATRELVLATLRELPLLKELTIWQHIARLATPRSPLAAIAQAVTVAKPMPKSIAKPVAKAPSVTAKKPLPPPSGDGSQVM